MEFTNEIIAAGIKDVGGKIKDHGRYVQSAEQLLSYDYTEMNKLLSLFLDAIANDYLASDNKAV